MYVICMVVVWTVDCGPARRDAGGGRGVGSVGGSQVRMPSLSCLGGLLAMATTLNLLSVPKYATLKRSIKIVVDLVF